MGMVVDLDELALVRAAREGDRPSFATLVGACSPRLRRHLTALAGREQAEDLVQETWARAWASLPTFDERSGFYTWVHSIGKHVWLDHVRRRTVRRIEQRASGEDALAGAPDRSPAPIAGLVADEDRAELTAALADLPDRHREALILRCVEGLSCAEIGARFGTTPNAVSILVYRAKTALRERLERSHSAA